MGQCRALENPTATQRQINIEVLLQQKKMQTVKFIVRHLKCSPALPNRKCDKWFTVQGMQVSTVGSF